MEPNVNYSILRVERNMSTILDGCGREASKCTEAFRSKGNPVFGNNKLLHLLLVEHVSQDIEVEFRQSFVQLGPLPFSPLYINN